MNINQILMKDVFIYGRETIYTVPEHPADSLKKANT